METSATPVIGHTGLQMFKLPKNPSSFKDPLLGKSAGFDDEATRVTHMFAKRESSISSSVKRSFRQVLMLADPFTKQS